MVEYRVGDRLTALQYERMTEDDQYISEMSRGMLVREPRPGALHSRIALNLCFVLQPFVQERDLGTIEVEAGFRLSMEPLTIRGPDVAFIRKDRLPPKIPMSWWPFAPDLAIEIVSPKKSAANLHDKIADYFDAGTREVWVVEPRKRSVTIYRSLSEISIVRAPDVIKGGDLLPGLTLHLDAFIPTY